MKRVLIISLLALLTPLFWQGRVRADTSDFVINDFRGHYEIFNDVPGGRLRAEETLWITFSDQNHGILRALPQKYKGHSLQLKMLGIQRDRMDEPYTTYEQGGNKVFKIGDPGKTITGKHLYEIQYEQRGIMSFHDKYDEWYWDINGEQWAQPFEKVSGEVAFPPNWHDTGLPKASCYTGAEGSKEQACTFQKTTSGYTFETSRKLGPSENLTIAIASPKGLFTPLSFGDWLREHAWQLVGLAVGIVIALWCVRQWWRHGKDYKGTGIIVPEYKPPKGLSPAEVGLLMDYRVDGRDLTATIIHLAIRGFVKIHDDQQKKWGVFKQHRFSLELAKTSFSTLKTHEKTLLAALFDPIAAGTIQDISKLNRTKTYKAVTEIKSQLRDMLVQEHGLIEKKPASVQVGLLALAIVLFVLLMVTQPGWGWIAGLALAIASAIICTLLLRRRSHAGVEMFEKLEGLKLYMNTAEKDRLAMLHSVERPYSEPAKTVKLFETLLPFAVALGIEKSWAKQFADIYKQPPTWYDGAISTFNMTYFASSLSQGVSTMNSSFTQSSSSSSSGTGSGGFSGGGGGGGGGGGW